GFNAGYEVELRVVLRNLQSFPNVDEDIHRAATNHSFFAGFIGGQRETMKRRFAVAHCFARLGPDFSFDTAATHSAGRFAILEEKHFCAASLRSRSTRVSNRSYNYALTSTVCLVD